MPRAVFRSLALLWLAACNSRGPFYDNALVTEGPFAGSTRLVTLNVNTGALILIDPLNAAVPTGVALPPKARHLTLTPDGTTALVAAGDAFGPELVRVGLNGTAPGASTVIALPATTDLINPSPDGHYALLTHSATSAGGNVGVIDPNEAVVVDLSSNTPTRTNLGTGSANPLGVVFAVPSNGGVQLAAVLFGGAVAVLDLANPGEVVRTPLQARGSSPLTPVKALFSTFASGLGYLYIQAQGSDDIVTLALQAATPQQKLSATLNFLAGGTGLSDIGLPSGTVASHTVLALYSGSKQVYSLDAAGMVDATIVTALGGTATHLLPFAGTLQIAYTLAASPDVFVWDYALGSVTTATLDGPFQSLQVSPDGLHAAAAVSGTSFPEMAILTALAGSAGPKVSIHPLQLGASAISPTFDASGQALYFGEANPDFLVRLDPSSLAYVTLPLANAPSQVGAGAGAVYASLTNAPYGAILTVPVQDYRSQREILFENYVLTDEVTIAGQ
jgi:hypothetical protein